MTYKRLKIILLAIAILLLVPLVSMQFTNEVSWDLFDFIIATILLLSIGLLCEFIIRKTQKPKYRIMLCIAALVIFLLIWAELAVGIFGTAIGGQ